MAALIGDLVRSRQHPDQPALFTRLREALRHVNDAVEAEQPLEPTIGDEFQGVYGTVSDALLALLLLKLRLAADSPPVDMRAAIGWGETESTAGDPSFVQQSGTAWWLAREGLEAIEKAADAGRPPTLRTGIAGFGPGDAAADAVANSMLALADELIARWSPATARIAILSLQGASQSEIAEVLGISQPAVSRRMRADGVWTVLHVIRRLAGST